VWCRPPTLFPGSCHFLRPWITAPDNGVNQLLLAVLSNVFHSQGLGDLPEVRQFFRFKCGSIQAVTS
jgi:hypothetical protein